MSLIRSGWTAALTLAALAWAPQARAQAAPDWRFADPGASLIGGFDVHSVLQSQLVKSALDQVKAKFGEASAGMDMALGTMGGVSQVYFSVSGRQKEANTLVLLKGDLTDAAAQAFMQGAQGPASASKPGEIAGGGSKPDGGKKMDMRRVDANTILFGDAALLDPALRRLRLPASAIPNPLLARAKTWSAGNDFWIGGSLPDIPAVALLGGGIRGLSVGLSLQQDLRFQLSLEMISPATAQAFAAQMKKSAEEAQQQNQVDAKLETEVAGSTVRMKVSMEGDKLLKLLADKLAEPASTTGAPFGGLFGAGTPPQPPAPAPKPTRPNTVTIYGLDGGPKEFPISKP